MAPVLAWSGGAQARGQADVHEGGRIHPAWTRRRHGKPPYLGQELIISFPGSTAAGSRAPRCFSGVPPGLSSRLIAAYTNFPNAGVGVQYVLKKREGIVVNLEYAVGKDDNYGFYIKLGYGF